MLVNIITNWRSICGLGRADDPCGMVNAHPYHPMQMTWPTAGCSRGWGARKLWCGLDTGVTHVAGRHRRVWEFALRGGRGRRYFSPRASRSRCKQVVHYIPPPTHPWGRVSVGPIGPRRPGGGARSGRATWQYLACAQPARVTQVPSRLGARASVDMCPTTSRCQAQAQQAAN